MEEIYGDVLFVINFSMDFLSLFLVGRLMHIPMKPWRVMLGASLGAAYGVLELLFTLGKLLDLLLAVGVMLLMCLVSFPRQGGKRRLLCSALFCGVNMLMGGLMTAIFVKLGAYEQYIEIGGKIETVYGDMPIWLFVILAGISALATWLLGRVFRGKRAERTCYIRLKVCGREVTLMGLLDSGNLLSEPLSGTPVIFIKEKDANFLSAELVAAMRAGLAFTETEPSVRLRFVPCRTATGEGLLTALVPETVSLKTGKDFEERKAIVAVDFTEGDYGGCAALVPEILV